MNPKIYRTLAVLLIFSMNEFTMSSQLFMSNNIDIGISNSSGSIYCKTARDISFTIGKQKFGGAVQLDIISPSGKIFTGLQISTSREFKISKNTVNIELFYLWLPFSDVLKETDWGVLFKYSFKHFTFNFGTNFKTNTLTQKELIEYQDENNTKLYEDFGLMYSASYYIKPIDSQWNIGATVTDVDYFAISGETNPMINLNAVFKINKKTSLFTEFWYKNTGTQDLIVNYDGFCNRTGIIWAIGGRQLTLPD